MSIQAIPFEDWSALASQVYRDLLGRATILKGVAYRNHFETARDVATRTLGRLSHPLEDYRIIVTIVFVPGKS